jgi:hypothetical protein
VEDKYHPDQIVKDAAKHGELVVFLGAGASMLCGSPNWAQFSEKVVERLQEAGALTFLEAEELRKLGDPRRTLSIGMAIGEEKKVSIDFDGVLHPGPAKSAGGDLYRLLKNLRPIFVTTNYDTWLDDEVPSVAGTGTDESKPAGRPVRRPKYYAPEHLTSDRLTERGAVIHLHGSSTVPSSMIVSLKDYIEHYADERVQNFLTEMFKNCTVVFLGYSLAELEILDYVVRSNKRAIVDGTEPRHFLLYGHKSTENVQLAMLQRFFREQCGVKLLPYCIDEGGYGELVEVIRAWSGQLDVREPTLLDLQARIDGFVSNPTPAQRDSAIKLVKAHPELKSYFLNSLTDQLWFDDVFKEGLLRPEENPPLRETAIASGTSYQADSWPALRYIERVGSSLTDEKAKLVIRFLHEATDFAVKNRIDNWRTWWTMASILATLPVPLIDQAEFTMIETWLSSRFEADMIGRELGGRLLPRLLAESEPTQRQKTLRLVEILTTLRLKEAING